MEDMKKLMSDLDEIKGKISTNEKMRDLYKTKSYCKVKRVFNQTKIRIKNEEDRVFTTKMKKQMWTYDCKDSDEETETLMLKEVELDSTLKVKNYILEIKPHDECKLPLDYADGYIAESLYNRFRNGASMISMGNDLTMFIGDKEEVEQWSEDISDSD